MSASRHRNLLFRLACWAVAAGVFAPQPAAATSLRAGEHAGFGRVVFTVPTRVVETSSQQGDRLILHLPGAGAVPGMGRGPIHVARIDGGQDQAVLELAPGSHARIWHGPGRIVVDVFGADAPAPPEQAGARLTAVAGAAVRAASVPEITLVPLEPPAPKAPKQDAKAAPAVVAAAPLTAPAEPAQGAAPDGLVAERLPDNAAAGEASIRA